MRIDGKVVIVTGASEGIGAACAAEFVRTELTVERMVDGYRRLYAELLANAGKKGR